MTRKEVISNSAQFDERVFSGTSKTPVDLRVFVSLIENLSQSDSLLAESLLGADGCSSSSARQMGL